jgi:hypothetical protein
MEGCYTGSTRLVGGGNTAEKEESLTGNYKFYFTLLYFTNYKYNCPFLCTCTVSPITDYGYIIFRCKFFFFMIAMFNA